MEMPSQVIKFPLPTRGALGNGPAYQGSGTSQSRDEESRYCSLLAADPLAVSPLAALSVDDVDGMGSMGDISDIVALVALVTLMTWRHGQRTFLRQVLAPVDDEHLTLTPSLLKWCWRSLFSPAPRLCLIRYTLIYSYLNRRLPSSTPWPLEPN